MTEQPPSPAAAAVTHPLNVIVATDCGSTTTNALDTHMLKSISGRSSSGRPTPKATNPQPSRASDSISQIRNVVL